jgi:hypothetical protein
MAVLSHDFLNKLSKDLGLSVKPRTGVNGKSHGNKGGKVIAFFDMRTFGPCRQIVLG